VFGIRTDGSQRDELADPVNACRLHQLQADDGVLVEEFARIDAVRTDAADNCRQMQNDFRLGIDEQSPHAVGVAQIVVGRCAARKPPPDHAATKPGRHADPKSQPAGNDNAFVCKRVHGY